MPRLVFHDQLGRFQPSRQAQLMKSWINRDAESETKGSFAVPCNPARQHAPCVRRHWNVCKRRRLRSHLAQLNPDQVYCNPLPWMTGT